MASLLVLFYVLKLVANSFTHVINLLKNIEEIRAHVLGEPMPRYKNNTQIMVYKLQPKRNQISGLFFKYHNHFGCFYIEHFYSILVKNISILCIHSPGSE